MTNIDQLIARLRSHPGDIAIAEKLAETAKATQVEDRALPFVRAAAERHRNHARLWQWVALLHRALDQHAQALPAFNAAAMLAPQDARIAQGRAQVALEAGLDAVALFEAAHRLAPTNGDVLLGRTAARLAAGDAENAIAELEAILSQNPGWFVGHDRMIQLRWMMGDRDRATLTLERALAERPNDPDLWRTLIIALIHADRFDTALDAIARGRAVLGDMPLFAANEAVVHSETGSVGAADMLFDAMGSVADISIAVRHVRHLLRTGRIERALPLIDRWLAPDGAQRMMWPYASIAWRLSGDPRSAWLDGDAALVRVIDLADRIPFLDRLGDLLRSLHRARSQHLDQSVRGGTQTDGPLFSRIEPEIQSLRALIVDAVADHIAQLPKIDPRHPTLGFSRTGRQRFAGSWSVRLAGAGHHANHVHPAGWISSAFYVGIPDAVSDADQAGWLTLGAPQAELGIDLPPVRAIQPRPGRLVLFPSTMWHGTIPYDAGERLTVAFDIAIPLHRKPS